MVADASAFTGRPVTQVNGLDRTDNRLVPVHEQRIANAALGLIAALVGISGVDPRLAEIVLRSVAPEVNHTAGALRAAGYRVGCDDTGGRL